jgi:Family of unknown function (DUF5677)
MRRAMSSEWEELERIIRTYTEMARAELAERWRKWPIDLSQSELHEVVASLLARQVTLATQLAHAPSTWNAHIAPMVLRSMTEVCITLSWILRDPAELARKFILYGLGQQKLILEHRKAELTSDGQDPEQDPMVKATEAWLTAQRFPFLTDVNVGSWSGLTVREMAEEAGCLDLYRYAYLPFSAATHSMWHHTSRLNLQVCENPLHRYHKAPVDPDLEIDPDYLYRAAKYVEKTFKLFDRAFSVVCEVPSALESLVESLNTFGSKEADMRERIEPPDER